MTVQCKTYSTDEAAAVLGIHVRTLRRAAREGRAPSPVMKNRWSRAQIDCLAENGTWDAGVIHHAESVADEAFGA